MEQNESLRRVNHLLALEGYPGKYKAIIIKYEKEMILVLPVILKHNLILIIYTYLD